MKVIKYIKEHGIEKLKEEFAISVKEYDEGLLVLGYNQIESPKAHPIVMECRGLILDTDYNVVSRAFDRFFNFGEQPETQAHINWNKAICFEKVDGSLIKIYWWKGLWRVSTRGTAFAESTVNGFPLTFKDLVLKALGCNDDEEFQNLCRSFLDTNYTYIFEITAMENRVVKVYQGYTLHYLGARNNKTFEHAHVLCEEHAYMLGARIINEYSFNSVEECIETAKHLKDLDEGYVLWQDGKPVCKIKSPAYVAVHHIRGEGLNPKRISQIVLTGETDEYLKYFPEDEQHFLPYIDAHKNLVFALAQAYEQTYRIEDQKEFALRVKNLPFSSILFSCKKKRTFPVTEFNEARDEYKIKLLQQYVEV